MTNDQAPMTKKLPAIDLPLSLVISHWDLVIYIKFCLPT